MGIVLQKVSRDRLWGRSKVQECGFCTNSNVKSSSVFRKIRCSDVWQLLLQEADTIRPSQSQPDQVKTLSEFMYIKSKQVEWHFIKWGIPKLVKKKISNLIKKKDYYRWCYKTLLLFFRFFPNFPNNSPKNFKKFSNIFTSIFQSFL